ncbi:MAG: 2,4'-dihydroxyacetophenone dioxygenase family protein [Dongiaceae bacterium]
MNEMGWKSAAGMFRSVNLIDEIVIDADADNEKVWVPLADGVFLRPFMFDVTNGAWSSLLRVGPGKSLACHYHTQPVHGFTIHGSWRYLEHNWVAKAGTYIFEPPGEQHTLVADSKEGMVTFFLTRGSLIYTDGAGRQNGYEDVFTRLALCRRHYASVGFADSVIEGMIR